MRKAHLSGIMIAAAAVSLFATPSIAGADNEFNGQTYAEAERAIKEAGMTSRVGAVVGDALPTSECTVSGSHTAEVVGASGFTGGSEVVLNLNCNSAGPTPGPQQSEQAAADAEQTKNESLMDQQANPDETAYGDQAGG